MPRLTLCRSGIVAGTLAGMVLASGPAAAFQPTPHHAVYDLELDSAKGTSGVVAADGKLDYRWQEFCGKWTVEQKYTLHLQYDQGATITIVSDFATTESKDGKTYLFNNKEWHNGQLAEDIHGNASLNGPGHSGVAHFLKPENKTFRLPPGSLFPTAHTLTLIHQAESGAHYFNAHVFDGSTYDGTSTVSAVLGPQGVASKASANADTDPSVHSPLVARPFWQSWLSFYSDATKDTDADYNLGMRLFDNGVSANMILDYGNYTVAAKLVSIEPLTKPSC